jgi:O-antigen/teichoic acid export membrane protein
MTPNKEQQIKNSLIYLLPIVVGNLLPIATLPIFTRILTTEDYGVFALAQVYGIFVTGIVNIGLPVVFERNFFEHKDPKDASTLLYSILSFVAITFTAFALLTYLFREIFAQWITGSPAHGDILFWAFCSAGIISLKNYYLIFIKNMEIAKDFVKYTIDESLLGMGLSLFMVVYLRIGVIGLVWGQLLANLTIFSVLFLKFLRQYPFSNSWSLLKDSLQLGLPLTPRVFLGVIGNQFDKYMIGLMSTLGGVGIYSIGQKIAYVVFTYMTAIQNVFSPQVYKKMFGLREGGGKEVGRYLTPFLYVSIAIAVLMSLLAEEIISIVTPPSYHNAIDIVIILSMFYGSMFFGKQPQLLYARKTHITSILSMITIVINVALIIPFIMKWGVLGAAWATLLAGLISGAIAFAVSQHYYRIVWEWKKISVIYIIFFTASISTIMLKNEFIGYEIRLLIKGLFIIAYIYLGIKIGLITRVNYAIVKSLIPFKNKQGGIIQ